MPRTTDDDYTDVAIAEENRTSILLPHSNPTPSPWQARPSRYAHHVSSETLPDACQVAIIGTGLSGISTAWHLLNQDTSTKVVLLEARTICSAASGRNGGHLTCDLYGFAPGLRAAGYSDTDIAAHGAFEVANFSALVKLIQEYRIECEFARKKHYLVCASEEELKEALHCVQIVQSSYGPLESLKVWSNPEASTFAGIRCHGLIEHACSASINPYKLVTGMLEILMQKYSNRLELYANTVVTKIDGQLLYTSRGTIKCQDVVLATNGYTAAIMPSLENVIVPVRGQVISQPLSRSVQNCSFSLGGEYLSQRPNGAIVLGGGRRYAKGQEVHVSDDTTLSTPVSAFLHDFAGRLGHGEARPIKKEEQQQGETWEWTGIMGFAKLGIPLVMQLPSAEVDKGGRTFVIAGFTGHGMPRIFLSAAHIAKLILHGAFEHQAEEVMPVPAGYDVIKLMAPSDLADR